MRERKIEKYLIKSPKQMIMVITLFTLMIFVGGTTYAFFNYTRTGSANTLKVGRISFNHTQNGNITLTNIFPMSTEEFENSTIDPSNNVTINIEGDTTYPNGVEYLVTAEDVHITVNDKRIPLTLKVTSTTDLGDNDEDYFTNRGGNTNIHKVLSGGVVVPGQYLVVGYIAPGQTGIDGSLNISAYINSDNIAISDTYDGTESDNMGTTNEWVGNKTVFTTSEWNSLSGSSNSLSFKIRVEANEGIWVDPYTTPNLMNGININRNAVNIKEIRFIEETPLRMQRRYDASNVGNGTKADLTYQDTGKVLAWIEPITVNPTGTSSNLNIKPSFLVNENTNNNLKQIDNETSYVLYIASSGKTKWTTASGLFAGFTTIEKITFENIDSSEITSTAGMFYGNTNLRRIDLSGMGSNTLSNVGSMFQGCTNLEEINMSNFNFGATTSLYQGSGLFQGLSKLTTINLKGAKTDNVENMSNLFSGCSSLTNIDLSGMGSNSLTTVSNMFSGCTSLTTINMKNFNFGTAYIGSSYDGLFGPLQHTLININLSGVNIAALRPFGDGGLFYEFTALKNVDLSYAIISNLTDMSDMFCNCSNLEVVNVLGIDTSNVTEMNSMFRNCSKLTTINLNGFNTNNVVTFSYMFSGCTNLSEISLAGFSTDNVVDLTEMFFRCNSLKTIYVSNTWNTSNLRSSNNMFSGCTSLVGGNGTVFDSTKTDKTMAVIDTPTTPGYLTLKQA